MEFKHISVLLDETIEELHIKPDGIYVMGLWAEADMHIMYASNYQRKEDTSGSTRMRMRLLQARSG